MGKMATLRIAAGRENLAAIRRFIEASGESLGASRDSLDDMILAADEIATNIVLHGYQEGPGEIEIQAWREEQDFVVRLVDQGPQFDPTQYPEPDLSTPLEERKPGGLGIYLAKKICNSVSYHFIPDGRNELTLRRKV